MSEAISVDISGVGDHVIIPGVARTWITLNRVLLTVSLDAGETMGIIGKADTDVRLGPFFMQNGGTLSFVREIQPLMRCEPGEAMVINLDNDGRLGGTLFIERGQV